MYAFLLFLQQQFRLYETLELDSMRRGRFGRLLHLQAV
jgi:hypothetical protein